jgi:hypothetical protein
VAALIQASSLWQSARTSSGSCARYAAADTFVSCVFNVDFDDAFFFATVLGAAAFFAAFFVDVFCADFFAVFADFFADLFADFFAGIGHLRGAWYARCHE